ncbi:MAG: ATP-grasp domain-containing protein [Burkholderiales bacterium]|nr:ATP-grasp domain-containing protein [Burkholderiales bacterium]
MRVLVLNCYSRNSLGIINALAPEREIFAGAVARQSYFITCPDARFRHRRVREVFRHADPARDPGGFVREIAGFCREHGIDAVLPSGTSITNELSRAKRALEAACGARAIVEDPEKLFRLTDKWHTYEAARAAGVATPDTVLLDGAPDLEERLAQLRFPVVVKPRMSFASIGVFFFDTRGEFDRFLAGPTGRDGSHVAQTRIEGELYDVNACGENGRALCLLSQARVVSLYDFGGGGIVNLTTDDPAAREQARALLAASRWNGPIQFEFLRDRAGRFHLIECNPKFWGTTFLTVAAGMNVVELALDAFFRREAARAVERYEVGLLYRWLFPECAFHWVTKPRTPGRIWRRLRETFRGRGEKRAVHNLNAADLPHLLGVIFDRAKL